LQDPKLSRLIQTLQHDLQASPGYSWHREELHYKVFLYLRKQLNLKSTILYEFHASPTIGNFGFTKTYEWVKRSFLWDSMKHEIHTFAAECDVGILRGGGGGVGVGV
jgi:hypothetical protein